MVNQLLQRLPPFQYRKLVIEPTQSVTDIMHEVRDAHKEFAPHYDNIAEMFAGGSDREVEKRLFDFVSSNINYQVESDKLQTTISPAGILAIGKGDCKHYSSFTAGVLDALNRSGLYSFDWKYRFVGYSVNPETGKPKRVIEHVFVVVDEPDGSETWLDAAPIEIKPGKMLNRYFNDRLADPVYGRDLKIDTMLMRLSGIGFSSYSESRRNGSSDTTECCGNARVGLTVAEMMARVNDMGDDGYLNQSYPNLRGKVWPGPTGVRYTVNGMDVVLPAKGSKAQIPTNLVVTYPDYYKGQTIPKDLPRPQIVGNRLVLLPKLGTWDFVKENDWFWFKFMVSALVPLIHSYSQEPEWNIGLTESYEHKGTLANVCAYDLDNSDIVDYITGRPITLPLTADIPEGLQYLVNGQPLQWPANRALNTVEHNRNNPPPPFPAGLEIVYPTKYLGFDVPKNLPKIQVGNGALYLAAKGIMMDDFKANGFIWYSFIVRGLAPLINGFGQFPYVGSGDQLAARVWDDVNGKLPIGNYLIPPEGKTWLGEVIEQVGTAIHEITMFSLKFVNAPARLCFLGLVRINAFAFAYKLFMSFNDYDKKRELEATWRDIGGSVGELKEAVILGCKNNPFWGGDVKQWIEDAVQDDIIENGYVRPADDSGIPEGQDVPGEGPMSPPGTILPYPVDPATTEPTIPTVYKPGDYFTDPLNPWGKSSFLNGAKIGVVGADDVVYYMAAAASVIAALAKFLKGIGGPETDKVVDDVVNGVDVLLAAAGQDPIGTGGIAQVPVKVTDPVTGKEYTIYPPKQFNSSPGILEWIKNNPIQSIAIGAGAYYIMTKRKSKR